MKDLIIFAIIMAICLTILIVCFSPSFAETIINCNNTNGNLFGRLVNGYC